MFGRISPSFRRDHQKKEELHQDIRRLDNSIHSEQLKEDLAWFEHKIGNKMLTEQKQSSPPFQKKLMQKRREEAIQGEKVIPLVDTYVPDHVFYDAGVPRASTSMGRIRHNDTTSADLSLPRVGSFSRLGSGTNRSTLSRSAKSELMFAADPASLALAESRKTWDEANQPNWNVDDAEFDKELSYKDIWIETRQHQEKEKVETMKLSTLNRNVLLHGGEKQRKERERRVVSALDSIFFNERSGDMTVANHPTVFRTFARRQREFGLVSQDLQEHHNTKMKEFHRTNSSFRDNKDNTRQYMIQKEREKARNKLLARNQERLEQSLLIGEQYPRVKLVHEQRNFQASQRIRRHSDGNPYSAAEEAWKSIEEFTTNHL